MSIFTTLVHDIVLLYSLHTHSHLIWLWSAICWLVSCVLQHNWCDHIQMAHIHSMLQWYSFQKSDVTHNICQLQIEHQMFHLKMCHTGKPITNYDEFCVMFTFEMIPHHHTVEWFSMKRLGLILSFFSSFHRSFKSRYKYQDLVSISHINHRRCPDTWASFACN